MSSGDQLHFVHRLPRRTRLKVPQRRRDKIFFADAERRLKALNGVHRVSASPETASIVVHHSPEFSWTSVRFKAMGLRPAETSAECTCTCARCSTAAEVDLENALVWLLKAVCSGQVLVHLVELIASAIIRSAVSDLITPDAART